MRWKRRGYICSSPRNLANDIANRPGSLHVVQLISPQSHVFLHAGDECIVDINLGQRMLEHSVTDPDLGVNANLIQILDKVAERG